MMKTNTISVVISAFNEEKKIRECLESVKWVNEIIFVDNSSTDNTREIAQEYTKKILVQKNNPFNIDLQKNPGIEKATSEWIMVLDADEVVTPELREEIINTLKNNESLSTNLPAGKAGHQSPITGFMIPRKNIIFGKWVRHSGWYPDYQMRLFRNGKGKYERKHFHEPIIIQGEVAKLNEPLLHYNYETVAQFLYKHLQLYAPNEAEELLRKGYIFDWKGIIRMPMSEFLSRYFAREGYRDGFHGLVLAFLMAMYHLAIFAYVWEKNKFIEMEDRNIIYGLEEEIKKSKKEISYWFNTRSIEQEKNQFKKATIKIKRKLNL